MPASLLPLLADVGSSNLSLFVGAANLFFIAPCSLLFVLLVKALRIALPRTLAVVGIVNLVAAILSMGGDELTVVFGVQAFLAVALALSAAETHSAEEVRGLPPPPDPPQPGGPAQ